MFMMLHIHPGQAISQNFRWTTKAAFLLGNTVDTFDANQHMSLSI